MIRKFSNYISILPKIYQVQAVRNSLDAYPEANYAVTKLYLSEKFLENLRTIKIKSNYSTEKLQVLKTNIKLRSYLLLNNEKSHVFNGFQVKLHTICFQAFSWEK